MNDATTHMTNPGELALIKSLSEEFKGKIIYKESFSNGNWKIDVACINDFYRGFLMYMLNKFKQSVNDLERKLQLNIN